MANGCSNHTGEMLMFYCTSCKQAICQVCLLNDHLPSNRHKLSSIEEEAQRLKNIHKHIYKNIQKRCADNNMIFSQQNQTQQTKLREIKTSAERFIKILDSTRQQMSQFMQEIEDRQKQSTEIAVNIGKYQDDSDKLKELMEGDDLQLVLSQKCASDLITKLIQTPPIRIPTQCQSAEQVADIVLSHSDQLRQLAVDQHWKYNNRESKETQTGDTEDKMCTCLCPVCKLPEDGRDMVGCDACDTWYHWSCVGIEEEPIEDKWYCIQCINRQQETTKIKEEIETN
ncbi:uncharacterized protein [Amphiura filiformis]|uniref:uncharacterized protein n=1 Tax=Amphiura filiformis TaxID=82378 RepID=UPI003B20C8B9